MERLNMNIQGMTCGHCVMAVRKALEGLDGVQVERVAIGGATVVIDPSRTSNDAIADAIEDEGYTVVSTEPAPTR